MKALLTTVALSVGFTLGVNQPTQADSSYGQGRLLPKDYQRDNRDRREDRRDRTERLEDKAQRLEEELDRSLERTRRLEREKSKTTEQLERERETNQQLKRGKRREAPRSGYKEEFERPPVRTPAPAPVMRTPAPVVRTPAPIPTQPQRGYGPSVVDEIFDRVDNIIDRTRKWDQEDEASESPPRAPAPTQPTTKPAPAPTQPTTQPTQPAVQPSAQPTQPASGALNPANLQTAEAVQQLTQQQRQTILEQFDAKLAAGQELTSEEAKLRRLMNQN